MQSNRNDACAARGPVGSNGEKIHLEQFTLVEIHHKTTYSLSVINTGKKITSGIAHNVSLLWDEERIDCSGLYGKAVARFRRAFILKVNNRAKMIGMPVFQTSEDAMEVLTGDISNPFLGDIRDSSKYSSFPTGIYIGELQHGKPHGVGRMVYREQWSFYKGEWKDGLYHGMGTMLLKRGKRRSIYEGEWENNRIHGKGKMIHVGIINPETSDRWIGFYDNSYIYNGDWKKDKKHGIGKIVEYSHKDEHPIETVYEGEWKNDNFHGNGKLYSDCGDIYIGQFSYGNRHGVGKVIYYNDKEDDWYEGDWEDDAEHGEGKKMFKNGDFYEGEYYNFGKVEFKYHLTRHGVFHHYWYEGKKTFANGDVYVGKFYDHLRWGVGEMSFLQDGSVYHGTWSNDQMHGKGTFMYSDGTVDEGKWRRGVRMDDDDSVGSKDSALYLVSESEGSSDDSDADGSDKSVEKSEVCPSCKTLTASFIKSFPSPNVMCMCCQDEFCPIYVIMPCGHFVCEDCKDTYYGDNIPDIGAMNIDE
jgi:hypothetical protein